MEKGNTYTRKLQPMGNSKIVSLPKKWINLYDLKDKDLVSIKIESDSSLKITPSMLIKERQDIEELTIEFYNEVGKEILEKCLSGTQKIRIFAEKRISQDSLEQIRYFVNKLPTATITLEKPQEIIIHNPGVKDLPSEEILRGIFSNLQDMFTQIRKKNLSEIKLSKI